MARDTTVQKRSRGNRPHARTGPGRARTRPRGEAAARRVLVDAGLTLQTSGLTPGRSGNVSLRFGDGMMISPTGMPYVEIKPSDIVYVGGDGNAAGDQRKPSSEWRFHLAALAARPDRHAVVHTHSLHATVLACRHEPIPAFHYMVAVAGGDSIPCVPYAAFGTEELARHVAEGLRSRDACLMANHGMIAIGETMAKALDLTREVEELAKQYVQVQLLGGPKLLSKAQMADVLERFSTYGQAHTKT